MDDPERSDRLSDADARQRAGSAEEARERVMRVVSWYTGRLLAARGAGRTGEVELLLAKQRACKADLQALSQADEAEAARVAERYARLYQELSGEHPGAR